MPYNPRASIFEDTGSAPVDGGNVATAEAPVATGSKLTEFFWSNPWYNQEYQNLAPRGDLRSREDWLSAHIAASPVDQTKWAQFQAGDLPSGIGGLLDKAAGDVATFDQGGDTPPNFFDAPKDPALPPMIQSVMDTLFPPQTGTAGSIAGTPGQLAGGGPGGPDVVISPTVNTSTNNILNVITNNIVNFFGGKTDTGAGDTGGTVSPVTTLPPVVVNTGQGSTSDIFTAVSTAISNFFGGGGSTVTPPSNGAPLVNPAAFGEVANPGQYAVGQRLDPAQATPQGTPNPVAATIRGLNIPGLSAIKSDRLLIMATIAAPFLALGLLWALGKIFRK